MDGSIEFVERVNSTFSKACNLKCNILDLQGQGSEKEYSELSFCSYCKNKQKERYNTIKCKNLHKHACYQSKKWHGKNLYLCPAGLAFFCVTLSQNDDLRYCLYSGPYLLDDKKNEAEIDLGILFSSMIPDTLLHEFEKLQIIKKEKICSALEVLHALTKKNKIDNDIEINNTDDSLKANSEKLFELYCNKISVSYEFAYPIELERLLQVFIVLGDKLSAQEVLNKILDNILDNLSDNIQKMKVRITELIVLLSRAAIEGGATVLDVFRLNYNYYDDINSIDNIDDLINWVKEVVAQYLNITYEDFLEGHSEVVRKIIIFLHSNYMKKIRLKEVSNNVHYSVSYICRLFKDEMGINITSYINKVRIKNAKIILLNSDISLVNVAKICGFEDQSYFTKVFKCEVGISPGHYREEKDNDTFNEGKATENG